MVEENKTDIRLAARLDALLAAAQAQEADQSGQQVVEQSFLEPAGDLGSEQEKVILTSYPRSGNTLLRTYLEKISRVHTGSDCDLKRKLNRELQEMGLQGEGRVNNSVWIVKTHYPERIGRVEFIANKCVIIVRNPLDAIFSLFNLVGTTSHNQSIDPHILKKATQETELWTDFIRQEASVWDDFHNYWLQRSNKIPVHFITYESLLTEPATALTDLFKFLLNRPSLDGLVVADRIAQACNQSGQQQQVYKPRSGKINCNVAYYTPTHLSFLYERCHKNVHSFGYQQYFTAAGLATDEHGPHARLMSEQNAETLELLPTITSSLDYLDRVRVMVNRTSDLIRPETPEDPTRRGMRKYKKAIVAFAAQEKKLVQEGDFVADDQEQAAAQK